MGGFGGGFLQGFADSYARSHREKLDQNLAQRGQLADLGMRALEQARPEAQLKIITNLSRLISSDPGKKIDKDLMDISSWLTPPEGYGQQGPDTPGPREFTTGSEMVPGTAGNAMAAPPAGLRGAGMASVPGIGGGGQSSGRALAPPPDSLAPPQFRMTTQEGSEPLAGTGPFAAPAPPPWAPFYSPEERMQMAAAGQAQSAGARIRGEKDALRQTMPEGMSQQDQARWMAGGQPQGIDSSTTPIELWVRGFQQRLGRMPTDEEVTQHLLEIQRPMAMSASDKEISDYLAAQGLEDTPVTRDAARVALDKRSEGEPIQLSDDALDVLAGIYIRTGQAPAFGLGGADLRQRFYNRVGELSAGKGRPGTDGGTNIAANRADFTALQGALTQLQRNRSAVGAFESTALKNLEMFEKEASKLVDTGSPWVNAPLRQVAGGGFGSDAQARANVARQVALVEVARVVNNPNLTGVLSDAARREIENLIGPEATYSNIVGAVQVLKQDMANRKQGLDDEIEAIRTQIRSTGPPVAAGGQNVSRETITIEMGGKRYQYKGTGSTEDLTNYTEVPAGR